MRHACRTLPLIHTPVHCTTWVAALRSNHQAKVPRPENSGPCCHIMGMLSTAPWTALDWAGDGSTTTTQQNSCDWMHSGPCCSISSTEKFHVRNLQTSVPERRGGRLEALEPLCLLLEGVQSCRGCLGAIGLPLLVCLLVKWPVGRTSPVRRDVERFYASHAEHVQASLRKEVLAHGTVLAVLNTDLPVDLRRDVAGVDVLK